MREVVCDQKRAGRFMIHLDQDDHERAMSVFSFIRLIFRNFPKQPGDFVRPPLLQNDRSRMTRTVACVNDWAVDFENLES